MRVLVCLVTPEATLSRLVGTQPALLVPSEAARRGYLGNREARIVPVAWVPKEGDRTADAFDRFLLGRLDGIDAALLIVDEAWCHIVANVRDAAFVVPFVYVDSGRSTQNFLQQISTRSLRAFGQLLAKFDRADDGHLLSLPLRNFDAPELREIVRLCRDFNLSPTFSDDVETQLAKLRRRERPRKRSNYPRVYAVDDRDRFFHYGLERHSRFATGAPHRPFCSVTGQLRFGRVLDPDRHYNVSETEKDRTSISGDFLDCHGTIHTVSGAVTHLNMFANDYFGYEKREEL